MKSIPIPKAAPPPRWDNLLAGEIEVLEDAAVSTPKLYYRDARARGAERAAALIEMLRRFETRLQRINRAA